MILIHHHVGCEWRHYCCILLFGLLAVVRSRGGGGGGGGGGSQCCKVAMNAWKSPCYIIPTTIICAEEFAVIVGVATAVTMATR